MVRSPGSQDQQFQLLDQQVRVFMAPQGLRILDQQLELLDEIRRVGCRCRHDVNDVYLMRIPT